MIVRFFEQWYRKWTGEIKEDTSVIVACFGEYTDYVVFLSADTVRVEDITLDDSSKNQIADNIKSILPRIRLRVPKIYHTTECENPNIQFFHEISRRVGGLTHWSSIHITINRALMQMILPRITAHNDCIVLTALEPCNEFSVISST